MKRLKNPKKVLFFNTLAATDVGVYDDAKAPGGTKAVLNFKKEGVSLVGKAAIDTTPSLTAMPSGLKCTASYSDDGVYQSMLLKLNAPASNEDIFYDYGLTIRKKVKTPGVGTFHNNTYEKTYGGTLDVVATSSGYVTDAYKLIMENDILDFITNDVSMHSNNTDINTNFAGSIVEARRCYLLTGLGTTADQTVSLYDEDGVLITGTTVTIGTNIGTAIKAMNDDAQFTAVALAVAASTTSFYVLFKTAGYKGTVAIDDGTDNTLTISTRYIHLVAKDTEVQFDAIFEGDFFTKYNFGILSLTFGDNKNTEWSVNSLAEVVIVSGANTAALVSAINAATLGGTTAGTYVYAAARTTAGTITDVVIKNTVDTIKISEKVNVAATGAQTAAFTYSTTNYMYSVPNGRFPSLTSDDVFRNVWNLKDLGPIPAQYANHPTDGSAYAKYHIICDVTGDDDMGSSQTGTFQQELVVYVLKSQAQALTFDNNDLYVHTTPDCNFECLLSEWNGVDPQYWIPGIAAR